MARVAARGPRRAVLLCTHAMMANGRYFGAGREGGFADALAGAGIDVYVLDWRGHGASRTERGARWGFDEYVERDLPAAIGAAARASGVDDAEVCVLGHSLGGLVALAAIGGGLRVKRLALAATSLWLPGPRGPRWKRAVMNAYDGAARVLGKAPIRALRLGSDDESAGYVAQLAGWARSGRWTSRGGEDHLAALSRVEVPVWGFSGAGDRLCTPADARVMLSRLRGSPPLRVVGRAAGDAIDPDHFQLFTDARLRGVWEEIAAFVAGDGMARPSRRA